MALKVIGAGFSRTGTFSLKFALEHLGFGPCHHGAEVFAHARRSLPLWLAVHQGKPDWEAIFEGYRATVDFPANSHWRELVAYYPEAKVILSVRDPDSWFDSISSTLFTEAMFASLAGTAMGELYRLEFFEPIGGRMQDRAFLTDWFERRNQEIIDALPAEKLLVFDPGDGWAPLCGFLDVPVPDCRFPFVNSRMELAEKVNDELGGLPGDPVEAELAGREYIARLKARAFAER